MLRSTLFICFAAAVMTAMLSAPVLAHARFALVIGNAGYTSIPTLDNPANDARLMQDTLQRAGFKVTMLIDADRDAFTQAVESFGETVHAAGSEALAVFYFAGHGVRSDDFNYLLPLGTSIGTEDDIAREGISAEWILDRIHSPKAISVVVLDACRDNPFDTATTEISVDIGDGLARMTARPNNLIAYATGPGDVALDGTSTNSPYTSALARAINTTTLNIEDVFEKVRRDVVAKTEGVQVPWARTSLNVSMGFKGHSRANK